MHTPHYRKNGSTKTRNTEFPKFKLKPPKNPIAKEVFYKEYGKKLADEAIWERKAAQFGRILAQDKFSKLVQFPEKEGFSRTDRDKIYLKAIDLYENNELVRPIINLYASSIFSSEMGIDLRGTDTKVMDFVRKLIDENDINFQDWAREAELAGDVYLWFEPEGDRTKIWSLDARKMSVVLQDGDIRKIRGFTQQTVSDTSLSVNPVGIKPEFSVDRTQHVKINSTSTSIYGRSSLSHLIYWFNVLDTLFEQNWLRGAQYYGAPLLLIMGVPGPYQEAIKNQVEAQTQRPGRSWIFPPDTDVKTADLSLGYPIGEIISWVFRVISIGSEIPITLLGSADASSRGSAFFANPRFQLAVNGRREVWRIALRRFFIKIMKNVGEIPEDKVLSRKEFDIGFLPIFSKDLEGLADVIEQYRTLGLISKKSAREKFGLDHSDEEEFMGDEEPLEPVEPNQTKSQAPSQEASHLGIQRKKRKDRRKRRDARNPSD